MDVDAASMDSLEQLELRLADYGWHTVTHTLAILRCQYYPPSVPTQYCLHLNSIPLYSIEETEVVEVEELAVENGCLYRQFNRLFQG